MVILPIAILITIGIGIVYGLPSALLSLLFFTVLILGHMADKARWHPHLGLATEQDMIESGAEYVECPNCEKSTPLYKDRGHSNPCAKCGAQITWDDGVQRCDDV
jgi:ribosomal protein S27E